MMLPVSTPAQAAATDPNAVLKQILAVHPKASLHQIRSFHPGLAAMSYDQLGVRLSRVLEAARQAPVRA